MATGAAYVTDRMVLYWRNPTRPECGPVAKTARAWQAAASGVLLFKKGPPKLRNTYIMQSRRRCSNWSVIQCRRRRDGRSVVVGKDERPEGTILHIRSKDSTTRAEWARRHQLLLPVGIPGDSESGFAITVVVTRNRKTGRRSHVVLSIKP